MLPAAGQNQKWFWLFFCVEKMEKENKIWLMSGRR